MRSERTRGLVDLVARLDAASGSAAHFPELPSLGPMRDAWQALHTQTRLRMALEQAPAEGGPLNSAVLVHRLFETLQALSPGYLQHFITHADALAWLERLPSPGEASGNATRKPRRRR